MRSEGTSFLGHSRLPVKPEPGRFVLVEVLDDGCGMAEEVLERLFDPFFSTKLAGRGLGMAAVQGIVQGHGGAIMVESSPGRGTTFRIYFPVAPDVEAVVDGAEPPREETTRPVRRRIEPGGLVLVVDDEEIVRITAQEMLEHLGFSVVTAGDGREALELFRRMAKQVTLVVLDLTMPTMDGIETLAELRKLRPDLRVLLASGFDETEISERCIDERPDGFLQKLRTAI